MGTPYRVVTKVKRISRHHPGIKARGREAEIADHLFSERKKVVGMLTLDVCNAFNAATWKKNNFSTERNERTRIYTKNSRVIPIGQKNSIHNRRREKRVQGGSKSPTRLSDQPMPLERNAQ